MSVGFSKGFQEIQNKVMAMGDMVTKDINRSIEALKNRDLKMAHQIIADDTKIDDMRFVIEDMCIEIMGTQKLTIADRRIIVAVINIVTELERIGDYAEGNAKIVVMIGDEPPLKPLIDIPRMAELTIEMIEKSLKSFVSRDVELAKHVVTMDNVVDGLYDQVFRELLTFMMVDPKTINRATRLMWVAHNLERAADRVTNICERVVFMVTGKMELEVSKY
ncbi:MAG: phosphate signaling complex protein PhoU [Dehalococcoidia bacterium]|nr:phosphate signaling complex protein PhoU [Dehalococcoidia bacterium]